jgi:hypothetical protein
MEENKYVSLYDFFGRPAGKETGLWVWKKANEIGISIQRREVETPKYKGPVDLYPEKFLKTLFKHINNTK